MRGHEVKLEVNFECENTQMSKAANRPSWPISTNYLPHIRYLAEYGDKEVYSMDFASTMSS
jgi:hypothetical protein